MTKKEKIAATSVGVMLFIMAAVFSISIIMGTLDFGTENSSLYQFGNMLVSVYGICSVLIPAFCFVAGIFCFSAEWSVQKACCLLTSIIPFFTLVWAERAARSFYAKDVLPVATVKTIVLVLIAFLLVALEYLVTMLLASKFRKTLSGLGTKNSKDDDLEKDEIEGENGELENWTLADILKKNRKEIEKTQSEAEKVLPKKESAYEDLWSIDDEGNLKSQEEEPAVKETLAAEDLPVSEEVPSAVEKLPAEDEVLQEEVPAAEFSADEEEPDAPKESAGSFFGVNTENIPVVDLTSNLNSETDDDDIIAQFEKGNMSSYEQEDNSDKEDENYESEIPFDEYNEDIAPLPEETDVDKVLSEVDFDFSPDADVNADADDEEEVSDEFALEDEFDSYENALNESSAQSDDENEDEINDEEKDAFLEEDGVFAEPELESEEPATDEQEDFTEEKKTSEVKSAVEENKEEPAFPVQKKNSMISALDNVFAKMEKDASDSVNEAAHKPAGSAEKIEVKGPVAEITDKNGTRPVSVVPKKAHGKYEISTELLTEYEQTPFWEIDIGTRRAAENLTETLREFNIDAEVTAIRKGPVVTMFEMLPAPGVNLNKIRSLQDNIALRLAAKSVRMVVPIPGKSAVGIEIPNKKRAIVSFRECIESERPEWKKMQIPVVLGKDIEGGTQIMDLAKTPHLLIAGATGAGKSVCVNSMILSILYKRSPNEVKMILIDPKIVELSLYNGIGHLLTPVVTEPKAALQALQWCICEMERRYAVLKGMGCREIVGYNQKIREQHIAAEKLPYIVVVIDEFADLMATTGKQMEAAVARLAAKSRAVGIHLVLATQRPSVDVITGLIKANIPSRIAFMVASRTDSNIIIDKTGAEKLLGKGDMLYASSTDPFPIRIQGALVSDNEVENVVDAVKDCWGEPDYIDDEIFVDEEDEGDSGQMSLFGDGGDDPLYEKALDIVIQAGKASASYIQRRLSIGYNRAARLVELMEERGIVGPANGSKPREIIKMP